MKRELKASIMLFATAIIWGLAFVAQAAGMEHLGPLSFTASRCFVAVVFLYLTYKFFMMKSASYREEKFDMKRTLVGGSICGLVFTIAINLQQVSLICQGKFFDSPLHSFYSSNRTVFWKKTKCKNYNLHLSCHGGDLPLVYQWWTQDQ